MSSVHWCYLVSAITLLFKPPLRGITYFLQIANSKLSHCVIMSYYFSNMFFKSHIWYVYEIEHFPILYNKLYTILSGSDQQVALFSTCICLHLADNQFMAFDNVIIPGFSNNNDANVMRQLSWSIQQNFPYTGRHICVHTVYNK